VFIPPPAAAAGNRRIESITYTWNNINVWVGAGATDTQNGNGGRRSPLSGDVEAGGISWPWKKNGNGISKQILTNGNFNLHAQASSTSSSWEFEQYLIQNLIIILSKVQII